MPVSTAVDPVQSATLAASAPPVATDLSMIGLFLQADLMVKAVILVLLLASFWSWVIIIEKWMILASIRLKTKSFESEFWSSDALDKLHERTKKRANHPIASMFNAAMDEWVRSKTSGMGSPGSPQRTAVRERIVQIMGVARNREFDRLENGLGFLATVGTSAPFIGLFGTVWGIMNSFHAIALSKNTSLAAVAPGIAEALFATACGLFAAIPAVIAYNKFSNSLSQYSGRLEDFGTEFNTILSRQIEG